MVNASKSRLATKVLATGLAALAIAGAAATTAQAAEAGSISATFTGASEPTPERAALWFPQLRDNCRGLAGTGRVIREYVQDNWNQNPRTFKAIVLCQADW